MGKENFDHIISRLPYSSPFHFVGSISELNTGGAKGTYTFPENSFFYKGHFKDNPVTPGVILTECMAQIGVVCLGIYLLDTETGPETNDRKIALSSTEIDFYLPVLPGEKVTVVSKKDYFRFSKLKCSVEMFNADGELVSRGKIAGMIGNK